MKRRQGKADSIYIASLSTHAYSQSAQTRITQFYHACLSFVSVYQLVLPQLRQQTSNSSLLLIYRPRKDERMSWPGWLTYSGWFTHISGHPSATGRVQDNESTPVKDRRSTVVPRDQPERERERETACSAQQANPFEVCTHTHLWYGTQPGN